MQCGQQSRSLYRHAIPFLQRQSSRLPFRTVSCPRAGSAGATREDASRVPTKWLKPLGGAILITALGVTIYSAADDLLLYLRCSREAMQVAQGNEALVAAVGSPMKAGPWWHASLSCGHDGRSASATFPISGPSGSATLHVRAMRLEGGVNNLVYNTVGAGHWDVLLLEATLPDPGRSLRKVDLLPRASVASTGGTERTVVPRSPGLHS